MKNILFVMLLTSFSILYSCEKDNQKVEIIAEQIQGSWELKTTVNGSTGKSENFPKGNGNILDFTNLNYKIYSNGTLLKNGTFKIVKEESILTKEIVDKIIYDNESNSVKISVKIENEKLVYTVDAFDGPSSIYERK
ncbi:hypothetical protein A5893_00170 [Pedobacter psychrophilus]|uniref:Lipocalin-like domain-containing protein n=1 Tax=Pedobacter psychrophilus TaxID=1826909 RepID=A0A179DKR8_9SPHI|nr:hypothetical protein [Pedobacter psychrophilus]OAQ41568.1 hypothetical protein A5893_00170 [Pedobacter psychrophilus]